MARPRFLRATVGVIVLAIGFSLVHLLRSAGGRVAADVATQQKVREVVAASPSAMANLALLGDKSFLLSDSGQAFIMYGASRGCWSRWGDPVGPIAERTELVWRFRELCDHYDVHPVFYEVSPASLPLYLGVGFDAVQVRRVRARAARVVVARGSAPQGDALRAEAPERDGSTFEVVPPGACRRSAPSCAACRTRGSTSATPARGFSLGAFSEEYVRNFPTAIVRRDERIVAFTNLWCAAGHRRSRRPRMRYAADAPPDSMEFLFAKVMLWAQSEGYLWFNLGMAPLAGLEGRALAPFWQRVGAFTYRHGEHFYSFQGVRSYKQQFDPQWEARYLVVPGGLVLPRVLASVGAPGVGRAAGARHPLGSVHRAWALRPNRRCGFPPTADTSSEDRSPEVGDAADGQVVDVLCSRARSSSHSSRARVGRARAAGTGLPTPTPDLLTFLVSSDVGVERWVVSLNLSPSDPGVVANVTGNVFKATAARRPSSSVVRAPTRRQPARPRLDLPLRVRRRRRLCHHRARVRDERLAPHRRRRRPCPPRFFLPDPGARRGGQTGIAARARRSHSPTCAPGADASRRAVAGAGRAERG